MKKIFLMLLTVLLTCVLWGCECNHQWQRASCTAPQTCTACGEQQGEALGHTWNAATCKTPETCSVCFTTQGELGDHSWKEASCEAPKSCKICGLIEGGVLPHDNKVLSFDGDTMKVKCQICAKISSKPIDRALYLQSRLTELAGHWDLFAIERNGSQTSANNIQGIGPYLNSAEDGGLRLYLEDGQTLDLAMEFVEYQLTEVGGAYACNFMNAADQIQYSGVFTEVNHNPKISITISDGRTVIFQRNKLLEAFAAGTWVNFTDHERLYTMDLKQDRTFTANFGGGISGTWHLKPIYVANYGLDCDVFTLTLNYTLNGRPMAYSEPVPFTLAGEAMKVLSGENRSSGTFAWRGYDPPEQVIMHAPDTYPGEHTVIEADAAKVIGNWVTTEATTFVYEQRTGITEKTSAYTAVFNEDGTFEMNIKSGTATGKWCYMCTTNDNGNVSYRVSLQIDGGIAYAPITIYETGAKPEWSFYESLGGFDGIDYRFQRAE